MTPFDELFIVFLAVALLLIGVGALFLLEQYRFRAASSLTQGTVVDYRKRGTSYHAVVEYMAETPLEQQRFTTISLVGSRQLMFQKGAQVPVRYRLDRPQKARIDTPLNRYFFSFLFFIIGGSFVIPALVMFVLWMTFSS